MQGYQKTLLYTEKLEWPEPNPPAHPQEIFLIFMQYLIFTFNETRIEFYFKILGFILGNVFDFINRKQDIYTQSFTPNLIHIH